VVEREIATGNDVRCQGEANALENVGNGGEERENRVSREVAGAPTHYGEL